MNDIVLKSHSKGYEVKSDKEYAPLLGLIRCPVCGHNMTAALSTKMLKRYNRKVGYYVCSRKGCKCNASAQKVNAHFEDWLDTVSVPEKLSGLVELQLRKAFPILNEREQEEVSAIRTALTKKEREIEQIEINLALAPNAKVQEICCKRLEKAEEERDAIKAELQERDKSLLNLDDYVSYGMGLRNNLLKLWQIASLPHKRHFQNLVFPDGILYNKENDDIEPLSKNEFLFTYGLKSGNYGHKESGQTDFSTNLSALAPPVGLEPTTL